MSQSKLFDYNSSFSVIRTNPKITGNLRVTIDSSGRVSFNSMDANQTLSNDRFKNFNITGENSFALDVFNFFDKGKLANNIIFDTARFTRGDREVSKTFSGQYDFFYSSGASALADKNYNESFSYFAPLWIKSEIPDYFVIFKVPGPLSYVYSKNETVIEPGVKYKIIKNYESDSDFVISYGKTGSGEPIFINSGSIFTGSSEYQSYDIISGSGIVCVFDELYNIELVDDVSTTFRDKILPNCLAIKTFDLTKASKIGKYIRSIVADKNFTDSPLDVNWGPDSYTYYNGVSVGEGIYTRKGEILSSYFSSDDSDVMIDFESYVTSGFSRNGIIPPNILNLEFLFEDDEADDYSINRYFGMYVSRNDINEFRSNGEFYYKFRDLEGNENLPKPTRDAFGYYYNTDTYGVTADSGVRLFYEKNLAAPGGGGSYSPGLLPGSDNVNILDSNKLYYVTDKYGNFYSLKRDEGYTYFGGNSPKYAYGPYDESTGTFGTTGSNFNSNRGSLVIQNKKTDILNFTGITEKISTVPATRATTPGRAYMEIRFLKNYDKPKPLTFRLYWPNGKTKENNRRYDVISSADLSAVLVWIDGSYYSTGSSFYFNAAKGKTSDVANAFSGVVNEVDSVTWDAAVNLDSTVIRLRDYGEYGNNVYSIVAYDDYEYFLSKFRGEWLSSESYYLSDVVMYMGKYYSPTSNIGPSDNPPGLDNYTYWYPYYTVTDQGYLEINGTDAGGSCYGLINFVGGTKKADSRLIFPSDYLDFINPGDFINTKSGYTKVNSITRYVDTPQRDPISEKITGFENFSYSYVLNIDDNIEIDLGYDRSFNVYKSAKMNIGVFTFFDVKEFDFDFWSSDYGYTPTPETYKYYQIPTGVTGIIKPNVPYLVKQGQVEYNGVIYPQSGSGSVQTSNLFYGATGYTSIKNARPDLFKELIVIPAEYSDIYYDNSGNVIYGATGSPIGYNKDLDTFNGFIGIQNISPASVGIDPSKIQIFNRGKLETEYEYLNENYSTSISNVSRIVPFINKWVYTDGTDARGNGYRLNSSPAFSPTNFSPSFDKNNSDSRYLTHEWFLLEQPPRNFPIEAMKNQNSYLPGKIDLEQAVGDGNYLASYFTVEPSDYPLEFRDDKSYTKELFTTFTYNKTSGFYETLFRGAKITLKKRSNLSNSVADSLDKYVPKYRNYENYKFAAVLRPISEDYDTIQDPVRYRIIENQYQKFILFVCDVVMKDYKSLGVGYTGGTGGDPILDYTLLYSVNNKENLTYPMSSGSRLYEISDIKLSSALDLSVGSGSVVNTTTGGKINIIPSSTYDTDLREEIHTFFSRNSDNATSGPSATGPGSFYVTQFSPYVTYPWPIGVGPNYLDFANIVPFGTPNTAGYSPEYTFSINFSSSDPVIVPVGPQSIYRNKPVFQKSGGLGYYSSILQRISLSGIAERVNFGSKYIQYETYNSSGVIYNDFEFHMDKPSKIVKSKGSKSNKYYGGPQTLGESVPTAYTIQSDLDLPSTLLRYSGGYEPIFRKIIHFDKDKNDTISQVSYDPVIFDLSFRNCNFAPNKRFFGISRNLSFTKVSNDKNILSLSQNLPEGPVYPLVGQSPIWKKDFNVFSSSWDPGYYDKFTSPLVYERVAGTRSMQEYKGFLGSKIMKTPNTVEFDNYITLQIVRNGTGYGVTDVAAINSQINSFIKPVQYIDPSNSGTGIGRSEPYSSGVDYDKLDLNLFPNAEIVWQYFPDINRVNGIIRMDRMLSRYLLNDGIKQVFIDNIISEFGVGNPDSIDDDVADYIKNNVSPLFMGENMDLFVRKESSNNAQQSSNNLLVRGDIATSYKYQDGYYPESNFKLTKSTNLIYTFEYNLDNNYLYSLLFNLEIIKI